MNGQAGLGFLREEQRRVKGPTGSVLCLCTKGKADLLSPFRASLLIPSPVATKTRGMPFHHLHLTEYTHTQLTQIKTAEK